MHYFCTVALWVMLNRFRKGFPPVFNYKLGLGFRVRVRVLGLELGFRVGVRVYREIWPLLFTPCQLMHYFCTVALWVMLNRFRKGFPPVFNYKLGLGLGLGFRVLGLELGFRVGVRVYREIWPLLFTPCQLMHYFCTVALWVMLNRFRKGFPPVFNYKLGLGLGFRV